jgi:hypothetical protein
MKTPTATLIEALRILSRDIESEDGTANAAIAEAADRLEELSRANEWQPITEDQKDGSYFLGATPQGVMRLRWWNGNKGGETRFCNFLGDDGNAYSPTLYMPVPKVTP